MRRTIAAALAALAAACAPARSESTPDWARYDAPQRVAIAGYDGEAMEPFLSRDGRTLFFNNRNDPPERTDVHWAERIDDLTFRYRGPVAGANGDTLNAVATMSADGRLCFISLRALPRSSATVHCGLWRAGALTEVTVQPHASPGAWPLLIFDVEIDARGDTLVLAEGVFRGGPLPATADLRQARRTDGAFRFSPADDALYAAVNTRALEYAAALSADGLTLAFTRLTGRPPLVRTTIWLARRLRSDAAFGAPARIDAISGFVEGPTFTPAGEALYFHKRERGGYTLWRAARRR